jgi:hypothetical protein
MASRKDTDMVKRLRRNITIGATIVVIAGLSWFGLKQYRSQIGCKQRSAAFARQIESIKHDAHEQLKIGTKKADVARFFAEHSIPFTFSESGARGTLLTSGCAPFACGSDSALIGVRVKLDPTGTVTEEAIVIGMYTDCL